MRIGIAQTSPRFGEIERNIKDALALISEAQADLWVLPELFATGYQFVSQAEVADLAEPVPGGATTEALAAFCHDRGCHIVAGLPEAADTGFFNSSILVGPDGLISCYRKVHLFDRETLWFQPGDRRFFVDPVDGARVGMMVCFDHLFCESARSLALLGADVIAHPSNLVMPDLAQRTMTIRALENAVYTVTANRVGSESRDGTTLVYTGQSQIVSPTGEILVRLSPDRVETVVAEIDPTQARRKRITEHNDRLTDRRPTLYTFENVRNDEEVR